MRNWKRLLALFLCFMMVFAGSVLAMDMDMDIFAMMGPPPEGDPGGGPGGPGGSGGGTPENAAIVIVDGQEDTAGEYEAGVYSDMITGDNGILTISGLDMTSEDYTFNGLLVSGAESRVRLEKATIRLGVGSPATDDDTGGAAANLVGGATLFISDSDLTVDGAARYVTAAYDDSTLVVNGSRIVSTGSNENTADISEPFSNAALMISGTARANFSIGATKTYYYNSVCSAEGWAALSTDSATGSGLDLYAYNTEGIAEHGGYSTYADTNCRVWLYGSRLTAAEIGCIISKSGQIHCFNADAAGEDLLQYNEGDTVVADTEIRGGRNAVMIHAPDMMGTGIYAADCGTFTAENAVIGTTADLVSTKDYYDYGDATGAYIDYVSGSIFLIRSTSANIDLRNVKLESYNNTILQTVLNCDSMGNFLAEGDGALVNPIALTMEDMDVTGDILHEDYQRLMTVELKNTTLSGNIVSGTMSDWNALWQDYDPAETVWVVNDSYDTVLGVNLTLDAGAVWNVTGESSLTSLRVADGAVINGEITLDGEPLVPEAGETYQGDIRVFGNYVAETQPETTEESQEPTEEIAEEPVEVSLSPTPSVTQVELPESGEPEEEEEVPNVSPVIPIVVLVLVAGAVAAVVLVKKKKR